MFTRALFSAALLLALITYSDRPVLASKTENVHAILVPGSGTYSRKISTQNPQAQAFFDQGLGFLLS
jgi:hypothetical protein